MIKFEFTIEETNLIMASLGRMPYESVAGIIENIRKQASPQLVSVPVNQENVETE